MTKQRMIELLEIEHECMLRKSHDVCDSNCCVCDLVQDDYELHEMYNAVIGLIRQQEPVKPKMMVFVDEGLTWQEYEVPTCGVCGALLGDALYCPMYGKKVMWNAEA